MTTEALFELIEKVISSRAESQNIEIKAAKEGCPKRLYDTLSAFSNNDEGGIILFGIDESAGFEKCGVYDLQDLQLKITEQCNSMTPKVRPFFSYAEKDGKNFLSAEIPPIDITERPCYYNGGGRLRGSFVRVGTCDEPMTEYEIYSYEAYRKKYQDDVRPAPRVTPEAINENELNRYLDLIRENKPNLARMDRKQILELMSIVVNDSYSLAATLLFSYYPQAFFPQLAIIATALPSGEVGSTSEDSIRFLDNKRIEGTIGEMLQEALKFVAKNTRTKTIIDTVTGQRKDEPEYPLTAVREILLNALVHRDYSIHTEGMPIQLQIFPDRIVITSPGGLYGRITVDQLGKVQPDTRNPVLATILEIMQITENRYSGIPTVRRLMAQRGLPDPKFENERGNFRVTLYNRKNFMDISPWDQRILEYCKTPRTREEIARFLVIASVPYAIKTYIMPLVTNGLLQLTIPEHPRSRHQKFYTK